MNIFVLDLDPRAAARMHCDQHVIKMISEYDQLLSAAWHELAPKEARALKLTPLLSRPSHKNNPFTNWVQEAPANYHWLYRLWTALIKEYDYRWHGPEKFQRSRTLNQALRGKTPFEYEWTYTSVPADFVPGVGPNLDCIVDDDAVATYRRLYVKAKSEFARWRTRRDPPDWYVEGLVEYQRHGKIKRVEVV